MAVGRGDDALARVVLALSAFRSDEQILSLLEQLLADGSHPFAAVVVVDSLGSGAISAAIRQRGWPVTYWNAPINLGAAGNLAKRMELAASRDADWCYAVNADGEVELDAVRALLRCVAGRERIGAVYPLRRRPNRGNSFEPPRTSFLPLSSFRLDVEPSTAGAMPVAWASSNGALYSLEPPRAGLFVWVDLWLGWEDLSYSWLLWKNGWTQLLCPDAVFVDPYEHRPVRLFGKRIFIHDKPAWTSYYTTRNLALFVRRSEAGWGGWAVVFWRWLQESTLVLVYKKEKRRRLGFLWRGLRDGFLGRSGMVSSPTSDA